MKNNCYNCDVNCLCLKCDTMTEEEKEKEHNCFVEEPKIFNREG